MSSFKQGSEYQVGGSLREEASTYVVRQADSDLYQSLKVGMFCYVLNSRQMGKSSLRVRTMAKLKKEGFACIAFEMRELCVYEVTEDEFYGGFVSYLVSEFNLDIDLEDWWRQHSFIHPSLRLSKFVEDVLLQETQNIVIFIDEIDSLLNLNFKDDFFAFISSCYNKRAEKPKYNRLTIALLGVATPSDLIKDKNHTPFNIENRAIELTGFQLHEVKPLETALAPVADNPLAVMKEVLAWTGGQPFLTQWVCQLICTSGLQIAAFKEAESVTAILRQRIIENWLARDKQQHLQTIRDRILNNEQLACRFLGLYQQILQHGEIPADDSPEILQLRLSGLVVKQSGKLKVYNRIYKSVFDDTWVASELGNLRPYAEAFLAWSASNRHQSHLLQGEDLRKALTWGDGKSLSEQDYQFLSASQEREFEEGQQRTQTALLQEKQAQQQLTQVQRKTKRRMYVGVGVLALSIFGAIWARLDAQTAIKVLQLEQAGINALRQYSESSQIDALVSAMQAGRELKNLVKQAPLANYPTYSPLLSLQTILFNISISRSILEQNRIELAPGTSSDIRFSPDGKTLASANVDGTIKIWRRNGANITTIKGHSGTVTSVNFSPDGQILASASVDKTIKLWKRDGTLIKTITGHKDEVKSVSFSPDGQILASASADKTIKLWKRDGALIKTLTEHREGVKSISFSPDGQILASASYDKTIKLWKRDGALIKTLTGHEDQVWSVSFSPDGKTLASASRDKTIKLWKRDGTLIKTLTGHSNWVASVSFSPDGKTLASADYEGKIKLWNLDGEEIKTITGHNSWVNSVSFSPDGKTLASTSQDGTIKFWKLDAINETPFKHGAEVFNVTFSPDGKTFASTSFDKTIKLWKRDGTLIKTLTGHSSVVFNVSFSPDGMIFASSSFDKTIKLWKRDGTLIKTLTGHSGSVNSVSFSPDGQTFASASEDKTIKLWKRDGTLIKTLSVNNDGLNHLIFSPDSKTLAIDYLDKTFKLLNLEGKEIKTFTGHSAQVNNVSFSPDGQTLASASSDKTVKLWKRDGTLITTLTRHSDPVISVSFSPDGQTIASASSDRTVKLWKRDGTLITTLTRHSDWVNSVSFSPDGKTLASASRDKTIILWSLNLDDLVAQGCNQLTDYLNNHPQTLEELNVCQNVQSRSKSN